MKIRDGLRKLATRKQMELDSVMLERLKTQGPLWGPRDPTAPQEEELERLRRDNLQIGGVGNSACDKGVREACVRGCGVRSLVRSVVYDDDWDVYQNTRE